MRNLKIKLGFLSLLAILAVSVFLTSCEQQEMLNETLPDTSSKNLLVVEESSEFILPHGYDELSEEAKDEYLNSLNSESFAKLVESSKVATYFAYLGKYEVLESNAKYGDIFDQNTLVSHLTTDEVEDFSSTDFSSIIESRGCGGWYNYSSCLWRCVDRCSGGTCHKWKKLRTQRRACYTSTWRKYYIHRSISC